MKQVFAAIALLVTIGCTAQSVPAGVKAAFVKNFPNVTVKKWDKEDGNYEANFMKDSKIMSATFTAAGVLQETETTIKISELPLAVTNYVKANYKGATIREASILLRGNDNIYEAEVRGKDLLFDKQGNFLKEEKD